MSLVQRMFGRKGEAIDDPAVLRDRLFRAVAQDDASDLAALCRTNRDMIRRSFVGWLKPGPELIRSDPRRVDWYGRNLMAIAQCFAQRLGDASLLKQLQHPAHENPLGEWWARLQECTEMMKALRFEDALVLLYELRSKIQGFAGFEAKRGESLVVGHIGHCLHQTLRPVEALACYEEASVLCRRRETK